MQHCKARNCTWGYGYSVATCIVQPYNASRCPILQFWANWVHVITCAHRHAHSHSMWAETSRTHGFPIQTYGKLQSAITLIQRHESTIPAIKILVYIHSACPYKKLCPEVLPNPLLFNFFFFLVCNYNNLCQSMTTINISSQKANTSMRPHFLITIMYL